MAYLYNDVVNKSATECALSRASFDRLEDCYKLAAMGIPQSRRMWNDFSSEQPGTARLVIASVSAGKAAGRLADRQVDKILSKAEGKPAKKKKMIVKSAGAVPEGRKAYLRHLVATTENPSEREWARKALGG